jgi:hypothetical protein
MDLQNTGITGKCYLTISVLVCGILIYVLHREGTVYILSHLNRYLSLAVSGFVVVLKHVCSKLQIVSV